MAPTDGIGPITPDKFTEHAQQAIAASQQYLREYHHNQWDVEHLALALVEQKAGLAERILRELEVDPDAVAERMTAAGATVRFPVTDQPYGERSGRLVDPFGHQWMLARKIEDLSPEEVRQRTEAMFAGGSG